MQFKIYKTSSSYETVEDSISNTSGVKILLKEELHEVEGMRYILQYDELIKLGDIRASIPVRFYLYILNIRNNVLILLELMRGINNEEMIKNKLYHLELEEVKLTNRFIMSVYKEFSRKFIGAYIKTNRGEYLEVETESDFESMLQNENIEIHSITFIPKVKYEGIPLVAIRREGVIIVDMDYESAIKFISIILDKNQIS